MPLQDAAKLSTGPKVEWCWVAQDAEPWDLEELVALSEWPVELCPLSQSKGQALYPRQEARVRFPAWPAGESPQALFSPLPSSQLPSSLLPPLGAADHSHHGEDHTYGQAQVHTQGYYSHPCDHPHSLQDMDGSEVPRRNARPSLPSKGAVTARASDGEEWPRRR